MTAETRDYLDKLLRETQRPPLAQWLERYSTDPEVDPAVTAYMRKHLALIDRALAEIAEAP